MIGDRSYWGIGGEGKGGAKEQGYSISAKYHALRYLHVR